MSMNKIVIIGNGIAGLSAAKAARKTDQEASITVVTNENYLTYYRLRLFDMLLNNDERNPLAVHPPSWYKKMKINVLLNKTVTTVNPSDQIILLDGKDKIPYTNLIIASGSHSFLPPIPGINKKGIYTFWTIEDIKNINQTLASTQKAVVIGGGLLGLEAAYHMNKKGIDTTIIELMPGY
ncbi:MAG: nitrite reductase large subunit [Clostridiales bacterium]|nr:nitrite reductase large subunit [Caldanaerobacter sp.]MDK2933824.1 nitrite reductase large subunit [Clostridiales bacterium]